VFVEHSELLASITQSLPSDLKTEYSDLPSHLKSKYAPTWNRISQLLIGLKPEYSEFSTDSILEYSDLPTDLKAKYALPHQSETRVLGFTRWSDSGVYGAIHWPFTGVLWEKNADLMRVIDKVSLIVTIYRK
jgi:hypothetical protein